MADKPRAVPAPAPIKPKTKPKPKPKPKGPRDRFVAELMWGIKNEPQIHYAEIRPIPLYMPKHHLPLTTDCSGFITMCAFWAGVPDPNGKTYDTRATMYTGTLLDHCHEIHQGHQVLPGDLIVYGGGTGHHVVGITKVLRAGQDFECVSHGQEKGPAKILHSVERQFQPPGVRIIRWLPA